MLQSDMDVRAINAASVRLDLQRVLNATAGRFAFAIDKAGTMLAREALPARVAGAGEAAVANATLPLRGDGANGPLPPPQTQGESPLDAAVLTGRTAAADLPPEDGARPAAPIEMARIARIVERRPEAAEAIRLDTLYRAAVSAASKDYQAGALRLATELAGSAPDRAEALVAEPAFATLKPDLEQLLQRLIPAARAEAGERLFLAEQLARSGGPQRVPADSPSQEHILSLANHFFGSGTHADYLRASDLAQAVIDYYGVGVSRALPALRPPAEIGKMRRKPAGRSLFRSVAGATDDWARRRLPGAWRRAPLLVLLLSWLAVGVAGGAAFRVLCLFWPQAAGVRLLGMAFDIWGIGFLALVGFGFYMSVRSGAVSAAARRARSVRVP